MLVDLLKKKFVIEQKIRALRTKKTTESKQQQIDQLLVKLDEALKLVQESINEIESEDNDRPRGMIDPGSYDAEPDHEVQMARSQLYRLAKKSAMLHEVLKRVEEEQGLEGWVQAKITKASDYIDAVWSYLSYEMKFPSDIDEAMIPAATPNTLAQQKQQTGTSTPATGGSTPSPTPTTGGATPTATTPGMVKMSKVDANGKPQGTPIMVRAVDIQSKQQQGFKVIGESRKTSEGRVLPDLTAKEPEGEHSKDYLDRVEREKHSKVKASINRDLRKSFGKDEKGNPYYKWPKETPPKKKATESASAGATASGSVSGNATGFANGGISMQKRKKSVSELNRIGTPTDRARVASRFGHDPDRAAVVYKANKYDPETGLGGYVANRAAGDDAKDPNIMIQLNRSLDSVKSQELRFADGSKLPIRPNIARRALEKLENMRPIDRHQAMKNIMTSKEAFVSFIKESVTESNIKEFSRDPGPERGDDGRPQFMPWEDFIQTIASLTSSNFDLVKKKSKHKDQISVNFVPHDSYAYGPTRIYAFRDRRPPHPIGVRAQFQTGTYDKSQDKVITQFKLPTDLKLRSLGMTPANARIIADIINSNTEGSLKESVKEDSMPDNEETYKVRVKTATGDRVIRVQATNDQEAEQKAMDYSQKKNYNPVSAKSEGIYYREGTEPKFTGYYKGTDKGKPGKKMVGGE